MLYPAKLRAHQVRHVARPRIVYTLPGKQTMLTPNPTDSQTETNHCHARFTRWSSVALWMNALPALLAVIVFANTLGNDLIYDDT